MRHLIASIAILAALSFGGCSTVGALINGSSPITSGLTFSQVMDDAIIACQGLCGIAPTLETITSIALAAAGSIAGAASEAVAQAAATAFCNGVKAKTTLVAGKMARPHLLKVPVPLGDGVFNYGTISVNGKVITLKGTPKS